MSEPCFHCGQSTENKPIKFQEKLFCCLGCKTVYEILSSNDLNNFYELNQQPGVKPFNTQHHEFDYLDSENVFNTLTDYSEDEITVIQFHIPVMHCTSCVWLLESLSNVNPFILQSTVNFTQKTVQIQFKHQELPLSKLAQLLTQLGYKPAINLNSNQNSNNRTNRKLIIQLVVAGFCFGNIMLLAFPEYVDSEEPWLKANKNFFRIAMLVLSLPVFFYSARDYFISAWQGLRNRFINIDVPIALGILTLFLRSIYDVVFNISPGYFDSLCGLVFFMLIGKWLQQKTYDSLAFNRDYKSFYPIAITKINDTKQTTELLKDLKVGDRILVRNEEIIPADAILIKGNAKIDNSFITGESKTVSKNTGDKVFAGGKQLGAAIELEIIKEVNQSYLTSLWNNSSFRKQEDGFDNIIQHISKYFTIGILLIAILSALFWWWYQPSELWFVFTAVLIVACPCALSLSSPFIFGNMMRLFGKRNFYVKNANVIEQMAGLNHLVFDKTGTITNTNQSKINYTGVELNRNQQALLKSVLNHSNHPLSKALFAHFGNSEIIEVKDFKEIKGKGIEATVKNDSIKIGSRKFVGKEDKGSVHNTEVWIQFNDKILGVFEFKNSYRKDLKEVITSIPNQFSVISGDNDSELNALKEFFPESASILFNQSPNQKLEYIQSLQAKQDKVLMLGDGLNDAGALKQSNVGIAVTENLNNFSPSSDAILHADSFSNLPTFMKMSKQAMRLVWVAIIISFLYNIVGLGFAVAGLLQPVVAAILMPISSISVVLFATLSTNYLGWKYFNRKLKQKADST